MEENACLGHICRGLCWKSPMCVLAELSVFCPIPPLSFTDLPGITGQKAQIVGSDKGLCNLRDCWNRSHLEQFE